MTLLGEEVVVTEPTGIASKDFERLGSLRIIELHKQEWTCLRDFDIEANDILVNLHKVTCADLGVLYKLRILHRAQEEV